LKHKEEADRWEHLGSGQVALTDPLTPHTTIKPEKAKWHSFYIEVLEKAASIRFMPFLPIAKANVFDIHQILNKNQYTCLLIVN
jgi:hypothetical protein